MSCALGDCSTARPEGHSWPRELWFSIYSCGVLCVRRVLVFLTSCRAFLGAPAPGGGRRDPPAVGSGVHPPQPPPTAAADGQDRPVVCLGGGSDVWDTTEHQNSSRGSKRDVRP